MLNNGTKVKIVKPGAEPQTGRINRYLKDLKKYLVILDEDRIGIVIDESELEILK